MIYLISLGICCRYQKEPHLKPEVYSSPHTSVMSFERCPFCNIGTTNPPAPFTEPKTRPASLDAGTETTAHMILSTDHVLAFLDIMPLTRGHVLVAPRRHYEMLGDMDVEAGQEVCILHLSGVPNSNSRIGCFTCHIWPCIYLYFSRTC